MAMGLAPMGRVLFSPSRRSLRSHVVLGASLVPLSPLVSLALPFPLSLRKRLRLVKLWIGIRLLGGLRFRPPPHPLFPPFPPSPPLRVQGLLACLPSSWNHGPRRRVYPRCPWPL